RASSSLPPFPTRRSSDLAEAGAARARQGRHDALLRHLGRLQPRRAAQGVSGPAEAGGDAREHGEEVGGAESQGQVISERSYPYADRKSTRLNSSHEWISY